MSMLRNIRIMKNFWIYISTLLLGIIGGIFIGVKYLAEKVTVTVRKVKFKKTSGTNDVTIPISMYKPEKRLKRTRKRRLRKKK